MQRKRKPDVVSLWIIVIFTIIAVTLVSMFMVVYHSILRAEAHTAFREQTEVLRDNADAQVVDVIVNQAARRLATKDAATGYIAKIAQGTQPDTTEILKLTSYFTEVRATIDCCERIELYFPSSNIVIGSQGVQFLSDRKYAVPNASMDYLRAFYPADDMWFKRNVMVTGSNHTYITYLRTYPGVYKAGQAPMLAISMDQPNFLQALRSSMRTMNAGDVLLLVDSESAIWSAEEAYTSLIGTALPAAEGNTLTLEDGQTGMFAETASVSGAWHYVLFRPSAAYINGYQKMVTIWAGLCVMMLVAGLVMVLQLMMKHYAIPMQRLIKKLPGAGTLESRKGFSSPEEHFLELETALSDMDKLKQEREHFITHNQPLLRQAWLNCFVHGEAYYTSSHPQLGIEFHHPHYQVVIASAEPSEQEMACICELLDEKNYVLVPFESREKESVLLFNHSYEEGALAALLVKAGEKLENIQSKLTLGVGVWCENDEQVPASFRCARRSFAIRYFEKDQRVCLFDPSVRYAEPENALNDLISRLTDLTKMVQREPQEKVEQNIDSIISRLKETTPYMDTMRSIMLITAMRLSKAVYDMKSDPEEVYGDNLLNAYYHISGIGEFSQRLKHDCELFRRFLSRESAPANRSVVQYAIHHIRNTEPAELSIPSIAEAIGISTGHLSRMFHQETGRKLVDYLQEVRMEHAARLIADGELTNEEICGKIGYSRPQYFATKFKEHYGVTINEYRLKIRQEHSVAEE